MTKELEALLTELYVLIDDHVVLPRHGRGRRPELSDSELLCLAVAQMLLGFHSERRWVRHAHGNADLRRMFPYMPEQPGYCASYSRYYWGLKLYLVCAGDGMPIMWCLAHPRIGEREVVTALLDHEQHLIREGQVMLADKGFSGKDFAATTAAHGIELLRPDRKDETYRNGNLGGVRQWIESVNQTLKGQLDLEQHGGRTTHGVFTRVAQRLLAMAAGIWRNWATGAKAKRSLTAYDH